MQINIKSTILSFAALFAHFNATTGRFDKPFVLPQKSPSFYDTFMKTYNLPELIKAPVRNRKSLLEAIGYKN